jgi:carbonic anhydrase
MSNVYWGIITITLFRRTRTTFFTVYQLNTKEIIVSHHSQCNNTVRANSASLKDGEPLMLDVWGWQNGVLKVTACQSDTDKNVQDGIKVLSVGCRVGPR